MALAPPVTVPACANTGTHAHTTSQPHVFSTNFSSSFGYALKLRKNKYKLCSKVATDKGAPPLAENPETPSVFEQVKPVDHEPKDPKPTTVSKSSWVNPQVSGKSVLSSERQRRFKTQTWRRDGQLHPMAKSLHECEDTQEAVSETLNSLPRVPTPREATLVLNNLRTWEKAYWCFQWLQENEEFDMNAIVYNVTMKALRRGRQWDLIEGLLENMLERGIAPDNITYSTVISSATQCGLVDKAIHWFERMIQTNLFPDEVTYTTMIDAYSKAGRIKEALGMYEKARADGWRPDPITYSTLLNMYTDSGNIDGALVTFQEMKALGVKPNVVIYNNLFNVLTNAMKPSMARSLYKEMLAQGVKPNEVTATCLLRIFGKARWAEDACNLWEKITEEGLPKEIILCNTMLNTCADVGRVDVAVKVFEEMKTTEGCKPTNWSYTSMINVFSKHGMVEEANETLVEMKEAGYRPDVVIYTLLIYCHGRAKQFDEVVKLFDQSLNEGLSPDDKLCGCLLTVLCLCEGEDFTKIYGCIEKANTNLAALINMLQQKQLEYPSLKDQFWKVFNETSNNSRMTFCNFLIDLCYTFKYPERAHQILSEGILFGIYPNLQAKSSREWCLNLRGLSFYAAFAAFQDWKSIIEKSVQNSEEMPVTFAIHTGTGSQHNLPEQSLAAAFKSELKKDRAPFKESPVKKGWFLASREEMIDWMQPKPSVMTVA